MSEAHCSALRRRLAGTPGRRGAHTLGLFFYTPVLRDQIFALEKGGADSREFQRLSTRGTVVGLMLMVLVLAIIFLMVVKPIL